MSDQDWHDWRAMGIGGSDIAGILGLSSYSSPYKVWAEKVGLLPPTESTQRQRIGQRMETVLAAELHEDTGLYVVGEQTWCEHPTIPWARATVDGFVVEHPALDEYELRGGGVDALGTWQAKTDGRFGWPDGIPANIRAQCIWEIGVTQLGHCWLTVMFAGFRIEHFEIDWTDPDVAADWVLMLDRAATLWHDHIVTGTPPPVDGSDATTDALHRIYPTGQPDVTVELDDLVSVLEGREQMKAEIKARKKALDECDNTLRARLGDAEIGTVGGVPIVTYRTQTRPEHVVAEATFRVLRPAPQPKKKGTP